MPSGLSFSAAASDSLHPHWDSPDRPAVTLNKGHQIGGLYCLFAVYKLTNIVEFEV